MILQEKVLIIIPAYNEASTITQLIKSLKSFNDQWDIIIVNDGSSDETGTLAEETGLVSVVNLPYNLGIGAAVQTGFKYAFEKKYDYALQFDGDGQHQVNEVEKILNIVVNNEADIAIGSRFNKEYKGYKTQPLRRIGIKIFEFFSYFLIRQRITDHTSGFRAFNKKTIAFLKDNYPVDYPEPEVIILLGRNGFKIKEEFTQMFKRQGGVSSISAARGPYYMIKVIVAMFMASIRSKQIKKK
ncbi:MAG: glycosyltransferase family 2 protein [Bacteroidetes bacterium]|nr:glycosyltransferase family 2 protein [Bacteroidota bacterium]MBT6686624.1 glycosyltransferase family 2 protein [Bacteroidota bacterium]MBT7143312.1 glycosyltransferase family 2 protein [Bacteroidota bacterium]MBT7493410.1 glycosyltransferase family 2 protein [Bacteroidota bacterium]